MPAVEMNEFEVKLSKEIHSLRAQLAASSERVNALESQIKIRDASDSIKIMANTRDVFRGTEVMMRYEAAEAENVRLTERIREISDLRRQDIENLQRMQLENGRLREIEARAAFYLDSAQTNARKRDAALALVDQEKREALLKHWNTGGESRQVQTGSESEFRVCKKHKWDGPGACDPCQEYRTHTESVNTHGVGAKHCGRLGCELCHEIAERTRKESAK